MKRPRVVLVILLIPLTILAGIAGWMWSLSDEVQIRMNQRRLIEPQKFFSAPTVFDGGTRWTPEQVQIELSRSGLKLLPSDQSLRRGTFQVLDRDTCLQQGLSRPEDEVLTCVLFSVNENHDPLTSSEATQVQGLFWKSPDTIFETRAGNPLRPVDFAALPGRQFAQTLNGRPILQEWKPLGEIPTMCTQAVLAIEDPRYLDHRGISWMGLTRAFLQNLIQGKIAQGGSTITQQMVKNYFLTPERTLKRKFNEILLALVLELNSDKDTIFETYLNVIYMGQHGPFEVRGFPAAAQHYFGKSVIELDLHECTQLAALLNSPGSFNPRKHPEALKKRQTRVLQKMRSEGFISEEELQTTQHRPLVTIANPQLWDTAPYYLESSLEALQAHAGSREAVEIYTGLDVDQQSIAQNSVVSGLKRLEQSSPGLQKLKSQGNQLEGVLISIDLKHGWVQALVGGASYRTSPFNRATKARRQVGSLAKPFVVLGAIFSQQIQAPDTLVPDLPMEISFERQRWKPQNYDGKFSGQVPLFEALAKSLNLPFVEMGQKMGWDVTPEVIHKVAPTVTVPALPATVLGAFEMSPLEVAEAYSVFPLSGRQLKAQFVRGVRWQGQQTVETFENSKQVVFPSQATEIVQGMLQVVPQMGTAQAISQAGFSIPSAGKTGTTSDSKDAWFVGWTPQRMTLVWLGYDQNLDHGLTGGRGAVPIWIEYMTAATKKDTLSDFQIGENVKRKESQAPSHFPQKPILNFKN